MTNPAQVYGTPGNASTATNSTEANAFTPAPSSPVIAQTANAFGPMGQTVPNVPFSPPPSMLAAGNMVAQGVHPAGTNTLANQAVVPTGFQEAGLSNPIVPVAYHTTGYQASPPNPTLTMVRATPENLRQMDIALRESLYPSQREWAAQNMAMVDWHTHPMIVQSLATAAKDDPAATVRATCVRCLANMHVNTVPVVMVVRGLKNDTDPRVRQEAERALSILAAGEK
jgi:hypothetical protein